jgi:hypothetical protein
MKSVKDIINELDGILHKTQIIKDIRQGNHGMKAQKIGNTYAIFDSVAKKYIATRKKIHTQKKETKNENTLPDNQTR